jgi:hypothetical protein
MNTRVSEHILTLACLDLVNLFTIEAEAGMFLPYRLSKYRSWPVGIHHFSTFSKGHFSIYLNASIY